MRTKGKITSWNDEKGYGFISPVGGGKPVFVHIKAFDNRSRRPGIDQVVSYALSNDRQGRPCAVRATLAGDRFSQATRRPSRGRAVPIAAAFLLLLGVSVIMAKIPPAIFAMYIIASLMTFIAYAKDKSAARNGGWRTPESTLHLLSLVGGWPGALIAQQKLRHKSRKQPFRIVFWATVFLNCGALAWVFTPSGASMLRSLIATVA